MCYGLVYILDKSPRKKQDPHFGGFFYEEIIMKMSKGHYPNKSSGSAPRSSAHGSRSVNTGFSNKGKIRNNADGHVTGDSRKSVACKTG